MNYYVVQDATLQGLIDRVKDLIEKGWTPQGGICHVRGNFVQECFCQAMIKSLDK